MTDSRINRLTALGVFLIASVVYFITINPTVAFWDVGEFIAAAYLLQVPHPPGSPLFLLIGRVIGMIPFSEDIAFRMHSISAVAAALGVMFLYLVAVKVIIRFRGVPASGVDKLVAYGASAIGALSLAFGTTYWDNATEAEVYGLSMLFVAAITWLVMRWSERPDAPHNEKYILLIAFLIGLSVGIHLLAILAIFTVLIIIYFTKYTFSRESFIIFGVIAVGVFFVIYPGVVKWLPSMMDGEVGGYTNDLLTYIPFIAIAAAAYGVYKTAKSGNKIMHVALLSFLLIVLGYSTYIMVIMRANVPNMPMNENDPSNLTRLVSYLNREQYGQAPVMQRRYSQEPMHAPTWQNYTSDMDFMMRYQINHMYVRYLLWNYVGAAGDEQDSGVDWSETFGIPLLLGLFGVYYHFRKDWKMALPYLVMFLVMGVILALYQNQQEPQPRERDYFYIGSFFVFSLWIAVGIVALVDFFRKNLKKNQQRLYAMAAAGTVGVFMFAIPINMLKVNWHTHDRSGYYVAWDYSYNILQTCERDAIIFTNGDNDTFPLWYLQDVEGIRRDIRVVNLSLVNTPWYILQLKNNEPHGAKKVPISFTDAQIERLQPVIWEPRQLDLPVPRETFEAFGVVDTTLINRGKITFTMPNTLQFGNTKAIRVQDIMVRDIIMTNKWQRPIYFAVTVSPDSKIGLDQYLWMDGLAWRLQPNKVPSSEAGINKDVMYQNIMTENVIPSREPQYGYLYRGLDDPSVYFDENSRRLTTNYRSSYVRLALYYYLAEGRQDSARNVLARMERVVPRNVIPMDWRYKSDIMGIYSRIGNMTMYEEYAAEVEQVCKELIDRGLVDMQSFYNPYRILLEIYETRQDYANAVDILSRVEAFFPNDQTIQSRKAQYQALLQEQQGKIPAR